MKVELNAYLAIRSFDKNDLKAQQGGHMNNLVF